jgi:hypothetical protein
MPVVEVVDGIIDLIRLNVIAKTDLVSDISVGDTIIEVANSFHFIQGQEIIFIDYGYNDPSSPHYMIYEYARIKNIIDTRRIEVEDPAESDWFISEGSFVQKTIGHSPLYDNRVYYGDREVIPSEDMSITVEPVSMSNEWIYLMGGMSEEYRLAITIYGKDIETEEGMIILNKYADAVYQLMNSDLHPDINNYDTPILRDVGVGSSAVVIGQTPDNIENFTVGSLNPTQTEVAFPTHYDIQDNLLTEQGRTITSVAYDTPVAGQMTVTVNRPFENSYSTAEYGAFIRHGRYFYDSRIDNVEYGTVQKGSSFLRAARLSWFGKEQEEHRFPQLSKGVEPFDLEETSSDSDESSDST